MKWKWSVTLSLFLLAGVAFSQDKGEKKSRKTNTAADHKAVVKTVSYGYGFNQGKQLLADGFELDAESIFQGFKDAFAKKKTSIAKKNSRKPTMRLEKS
ncbi:MAG: FKBP-type peptidyl-prolyl cis-trans isomerase N-terminal domain-containing protein [Planctomycetes bacterium]|nr:FKBP-type peptidyl-prolyl cis-trans isomerase N-terminal domain-containing protein [Planctomycetota bacterium]